MGYEETIIHIEAELNSDELDILKEALEARQDRCVSVGEQFTLDSLEAKLFT